MLQRYGLSKILIGGFVAIVLLRFLSALTMGLMPQDAYYFYYSESFDLSYFDHPPMVAYMLKLTTSIFGQSVTVIKLTDFFVSLLSWFSFYYLASLFLSKRKAIYAALFYGTTLQLAILSINTTPDVPLILFWTLSLIALHKALFLGGLRYWALAGIMMGLTFNSKYTGLFLVMGLLLFIVASKNHRHYLFSKNIVITGLLFLVTISPIFIWNVQNDWISFAFQTSDRASDISLFSLKPKFFFGNIGTQLLLMVPPLFCGIMFVFYKLIRKMFKRKKLFSDELNFLLAFSLPIIGFFFSISMLYWVKLNWLMPGYIAAIILASIYLSKKVLKFQVGFALVLHLLIFLEVGFYLVEVKSDDTWIGWEELAIEVEELLVQNPDYFIFATDDYKTSAELSFYMDADIYAGNVVGENGKQFMINHPNLDYLEGRNAYFIDSETNFKNLLKSNGAPAKLNGYFREIIEMDPIIIEEDSKPLRKFFVYKCLDYQGVDYAK